MNVADFDYDLPPDRIASRPLERRDESRLLVLDRRTGARTHGRFIDLPRWLRPGDVLVRNDSRVIPARLRGAREGGGDVELLLLEHETNDGEGEVWLCLARPGRRLRRGGRAAFPGGIEAIWLDDGGDEGIRRVRLRALRPLLDLLDEVGEVPLPPYVARAPEPADRERYQTVYGRAPGSVAAPTAGLHFTAELLQAVRETGVEIADITLHVGPGTFLPVRETLVERHRLPAEPAMVSAETAAAISRARERGGRVVAVGTTTARTLEGLLDPIRLEAVSGRVSLFIHPGHRFRIVDALVTNFHLPRSTLLMLVAAFAGTEQVLEAYHEAIRRKYRFYSYGDAMFVA